MSSETAAPTLATTGQVLVTRRAAVEYAEAWGRQGRSIGEEEARRELTVHLLDARRQGTEVQPERWRFRRRTAPVEISAFVHRDGRLAVVASVNVFFV